MASMTIKLPVKRLRTRPRRKHDRLPTRHKYLSAVQALLSTKGTRVTRRTLAHVSKTKLIRYIKKHFTPDEVAVYLPVQLIYPEQKDKNQPFNQTSTTPNPNDAQFPAVTVIDINEPLPPTIEIASTEAEIINEELFSFDDDFSFDPGLWLTLPDNLPSHYSIPDQRFVAVLQLPSQVL